MLNGAAPHTPPAELASDPATAEAYWRAGAMSDVQAAVAEEVRLLVAAGFALPAVVRHARGQPSLREAADQCRNGTADEVRNDHRWHCPGRCRRKQAAEHAVTNRRHRALVLGDLGLTFERMSLLASSL